ncbi:MAG: DNA polymerase III subunit beta, partial [Parcubacteria group bacterium]
KLLSEYVNLLKKDQVNLELVKNEFLKVSCANSETKIKGLSAEDFPVIPKIEKENPFVLNVNEFKKALSQVIFAVSSSETRPEISGVLFCFNKQKGKLTLVGTDSYRLAEKTIELGEGKAEKDVIVPAKTLQELFRILNNMKEQSNTIENLNIYLSENQISFNCDNIELISRVIEGQYPDYKQIIPKESKTKVIASTAELAKTIKTVALFSKIGIYDINLEFNKEQGLVAKSANAQVGESVANLDVAFEGEKNETVLNYRYLLDGLNILDSAEVEISVVDRNIPCLIQPKDSKDYLYIIMPIRQ